MEFLKENRNIIILIAIIAIGYLFFQTDLFKNLFNTISFQWNNLSTMMKGIVILIVIVLIYNMYDRSEY